MGRADGDSALNQGPILTPGEAAAYVGVLFRESMCSREDPGSVLTMIMGILGWLLLPQGHTYSLFQSKAWMTRTPRS